MSAVGEPILTKEVDWESWAGEIRVNYIRLVAIALFYGQHLLHVLLNGSASFDEHYHLRATVLVLTWGLLVIAIYAMALQQYFPPYLKYVATAFDIFMIAATIKLTEGYLGVWNIIYLLPIMAASLRQTLKLIYFATGFALATYLVTLAYYYLGHIGADRYWSEPSLQIRTSDLAVVTLSILTAGLLAGQTVRQARRFGNLSAKGDTES
jgi:hypothetical protein